MSNAPTGWPVPSLGEWMDREVVEPPWLIKGFIPGDAMTLISGPRKLSNKTYSAFTMASLMATGLSRCGFDVTCPASKVLIVEEEGSFTHTRARWGAIWDGLEFTEEHRETAKSNILFSFREGLRLNHKLWRAKLIDKAVREEVKVVFFDAFVYLIEGDENDTQTQLEAVQTLQAIRAHGIAVVVLLHLNNAYGLDPKADIDAQVRGAGPIKDAYDMHNALRRYHQKDPFVKWFTRSRDGEPEQFRAHWNFKSDPNTKLTTYASLSLKPDYGDKDGVIDVDMMLGYLEAGKMYTIKELNKAWDISQVRGKAVRDLLLDEGAIEKVGLSNYRVNQIDSKLCERK